MRLNEVFTMRFIIKLNQINDGAHLDPELEVNNFVDIENMLKLLNFKIVFSNHIRDSGSIENDQITINSSENYARQRFSMAHELGHAVYDKKRYSDGDQLDNHFYGKGREEVFANVFAAQFLMPKIIVKNMLNKSVSNNDFDRLKLSTEDTERIINDISRKMIVSNGAMSNRIKSLKLFVLSDK